MAYRPAIKCGGKAFFVPAEAADGLKLCTAAQLRVLLLMLSGKCETPEAAAAELGISIQRICSNIGWRAEFLKMIPLRKRESNPLSHPNP